MKEDQKKAINIILRHLEPKYNREQIIMLNRKKK